MYEQYLLKAFYDSTLETYIDEEIIQDNWSPALIFGQFGPSTLYNQSLILDFQIVGQISVLLCKLTYVF